MWNTLRKLFCSALSVFLLASSLVGQSIPEETREIPVSTLEKWAKTLAESQKNLGISEDLRKQAEDKLTLVESELAKAKETSSSLVTLTEKQAKELEALSTRLTDTLEKVKRLENEKSTYEVLTYVLGAIATVLLILVLL
jgi:septal ring factor EnvC (AmiA/AmiB activator)